MAYTMWHLNIIGIHSWWADVKKANFQKKHKALLAYKRKTYNRFLHVSNCLKNVGLIVIYNNCYPVLDYAILGNGVY